MRSRPDVGGGTVYRNTVRIRLPPREGERVVEYPDHVADQLKAGHDNWLGRFGSKVFIGVLLTTCVGV
jgi:hypothetical protein